jgi:hypothetical protein
MPKSKILFIEDLEHSAMSSSKRDKSDTNYTSHLERFKAIGNSRVILAELLELIRKS